MGKVAGELQPFVLVDVPSLTACEPNASVQVTLMDYQSRAILPMGRRDLAICSNPRCSAIRARPFQRRLTRNGVRETRGGSIQVPLLINIGVRETNARIDDVQRKAVFCNHLMGDSVKSVEEIERAVDGLSEEEYVEFRQWFLERDWQEWDRQIGADSDSGKLDFLIREAKEGGADATTDDL
jgi:hypothetical protein